MTKPTHRRFHRFPTCLATGKVRFGERHDANLFLEHARHSRAAQQLEAGQPRRRETRSYRCPDCHGWHVTSQAKRFWDEVA